MIKKIGEWDYPTAAVTRRIYFYGMVFLIPVLIEQRVSWNMAQFQKPEIVLNFLFLGVGASAMGFFLWNLSTKWIGAIKTSVYIIVSPVVNGLYCQCIVLHEKMTFVSAVGAILILTGLIVSQKK